MKKKKCVFAKLPMHHPDFCPVCNPELSSRDFTWLDHPQEVFMFLASQWDVNKAKQIIRQTPRPVKTLSLGSVMDLVGEWVRINPKTVQRADPTHPIIVAAMPDNAGTMIIDGWQRIARLRELGINMAPAVLLTVEESEKVRLR